MEEKMEFGKELSVELIKERLEALQAVMAEYKALKESAYGYEENCFACYGEDLSELSEDEGLARLTECYCRENDRVPDEGEQQFFLDVLLLFDNILYSDYPAEIEKPELKFYFEEAALKIRVGLGESSLEIDFDVMSEEYTTLEHGRYRWDRFHILFGDFFAKGNDREERWTVVLDKSFEAARPENSWQEEGTGAWGKWRTEPFKEQLRQLMDTAKVTDPQCYHRAQISRAVFNKIINGQCTPKKATVLQLAIALNCSLEQTEKLLAAAGHAFNCSRVDDCIIKHEIAEGRCGLYHINEILYDNKQRTLG